MKTGEIKLMISHGKDIKIFSGNSNPELAKAICKELGLPLGDSECGNFSDGETFVSIYETVRGSDVFIIQSTCANGVKGDPDYRSVNDQVMELLIMIDAMKRASAGRITNLLTEAGADRVLTMDIHCNQIQGFFDIPMDNLLGNTLFVDYFAEKYADCHEDTMVVSPDVGSVARARAFAQKLNMPMAIVDKRRQKANSSEVMNIIGNVEGKHVILLDDMVDTAGSLCGAAKALIEIGHANSVVACASHGVLSGPALQRIEDSMLEEVVFLDTIPQPARLKSDKIHYISVAKVFAEAISRIYHDTSMSAMFR